MHLVASAVQFLVGMLFLLNVKKNKIACFVLQSAFANCISLQAAAGGFVQSGGCAVSWNSNSNFLHRSCAFLLLKGRTSWAYSWDYAWSGYNVPWLFSLWGGSGGAGYPVSFSFILTSIPKMLNWTPKKRQSHLAWVFYHLMVHRMLSIMLLKSWMQRRSTFGICKWASVKVLLL